jgi:hypothetical protein
MNGPETDATIEGWIDAAASPDQLGFVYKSLVDSYGRQHASEIWWRYFGARDASET